MIAFQNQVIEDIFFCIRALAAGHPFELAKERLYSKLDSMANKVGRLLAC